jgi:hypothetical protein
LQIFKCLKTLKTGLTLPSVKRNCPRSFEWVNEKIAMQGSLSHIE